MDRACIDLVLGLTTVQFLTVLAPIGLFLGILVALARFNRDSEMSALMACGVGPGRLLKPLSLLTLPIVAGLLWLSLVQAPEAARQVQEVRRAARARLELGMLESGRFATPDGGDTVIFAQGVDEEAETIAVASQAGFRCFTKVEEFRHYVRAEVLVEDEPGTARGDEADADSLQSGGSS